MSSEEMVSSAIFYFLMVSGSTSLGKI